MKQKIICTFTKERYSYLHIKSLVPQKYKEKNINKKTKKNFVVQ